MILDFARDVVEGLSPMPPVLEVGSRPAEGQAQLGLVRDLFPGVEFCGVDIQDGENVDQVEDVHKLTFADAAFNAVFALETLEHVADPIRATQEMHRVLAPGGLLAISSQMFFPIHAHPWDYWRFTPEGFDLLLKDFETRLVVPFGFDLMPQHVFGIGIKGQVEGLSLDRLPRLDKMVSNWGAGEPVDFGPIRMTTRALLKRAAQESVWAARRKLVHAGRRGLHRVSR
jgi:SAM-dependent methyltransferase